MRRLGSTPAFPAMVTVTGSSTRAGYTLTLRRGLPRAGCLANRRWFLQPERQANRTCDHQVRVE